MTIDQPTLFAGDELAIDRTFGTTVRRALDATSWLDVVPGWLSGGARLVDELIDALPFEQRQRWMYTQLFDEPRLTAAYPVLADCPVPYVTVIAEALSNRYGPAYDGLWINLYRDQHDSTGWHRDRNVNQHRTAIVPVLSLGAARRFCLKPRHGGAGIGLTVTDGDLVVMGGRCQLDWVHSVPKQRNRAGARVSINFQSQQQR